MKLGQFVLLSFVMIVTVSASASEDEVEDLETRLERIGVFKNGVGVFSARVEIPRGVREGRVSSCVQPSHGTVWVDPDRNVRLRSLGVRSQSSTQNVAVSSIPELIDLNQGRRARVWLDDGTVVEGRIGSGLAIGETATAPSGSGGSGSVPSSVSTGAFLMTTEENETTAMALETVVRVAFDEIDGPIVSTVEKATVARELFAVVDPDSAKGGLSVSYVGRGIAWAPSYRIDISDPNRGRIDRKAVVINEACDLEDVEIVLVTGHPALSYANVTSPLGPSGNLAQFLQAMGTGSSRNQSQSYAAVSAMRNSRAVSASPRLPVPVPGVVIEDLYLESLGKVTLGHRETAYFPVRSDMVDYEHVYRWDVPDLAEQYSRSSSSQNRPPTDSNDVWHSLRIENTTDAPWTTAPILVMRDREVIAQSSMPYTAPGATTMVVLSRAFSVEAEQVEREIARTREAERIHGSTYDRVELEGVLRIVNRLESPIRLEVVKTISGELLASTPAASAEISSRGLRAANQKAVLSWELDLDPGDERRVTYTYSLLVR